MDSETGSKGRERKSQFLPMVVGVAAVAVILAALHGANELISQFLMAFVITVAVAPVQSWLIRRGVGSLWAFLITVIATIVGIGLVITVLTSSINQFVQDLPQYKDEFAALQSQVTETLASFGISASTAEASPADTSDLAASVAAAASWLVSAFANFGFMLGLAAFMLFEATAMPAKIRAIALPTSREPLNRFVNNVRSYVIVTTWVNLLVGVVDTVLLFAMGVPYAVLWGALAFLFGFIPSIGFILSLIGPALMALLVSGPEAAVVVIVAFIVINGGIQNIILPRRMGEGTDLSPAVVFASLLFWGFILGPVGAILSVPMTMIVRLSLEFSESTRGLAYLVSSGKHPFNGNQAQAESEATP